MKRTCDGRCCAVFPLQKGALERMAAGLVTDGAFVVDMVIPLTRRQASDRARRFGYKLPWRSRVFARGYDLFTCRHWNEETRLCSVYADRPQLCREYPYDHACDHADCCYTAPEKTRSRWRRIRREQAKDLLELVDRVA